MSYSQAMSIQNLDQLAWDYLMGSLRDQVALSNTLVNVGAAAVFPLLRAGLRVAQEFNPLETPGVKRLDRQTAEQVWIYEIAEPMLRSIYTVISAIGQPAYDALCRALWDPDERLKVFAAVALLQDPHPSSRTARQVQDAFNQITSKDRGKKYFMQSGIFIVLSHILAQGGDAKHQQALREWAADHQMNEDQVLEVSRNTLLLYLIR